MEGVGGGAAGTGLVLRAANMESGCMECLCDDSGPETNDSVGRPDVPSTLEVWVLDDSISSRGLVAGVEPRDEK